MAEKTLRICEKGHRYFKSSDCPTCPKCEALNKLNNEFLAQFASPVRRALQTKNITTAEQLAQYSEKEILALHGIGRSSLPKFYAALETVGLTFQPEERTSG